MSEWVSVLAVFWVLWALDGWRLGPRRIFTLVGRGRRARASIRHQRLSLPGALPTDWRMTAADVPLAFSPAGVCNRPAGVAGRPVDHEPIGRAWRWEEVREVGVAGGWLFVNGVRFCADTGHVPARELLALAQLPRAAREARLRVLLARWFRPAHVRRRARVLAGRTSTAAMLNGFTLIVMLGLTIYVAGDLATRLPTRWSEALVTALPWVLLSVLMSHVTAVTLVWRAVRRLKPVVAQKRGANLFSALMLPPQALRLRAIAGEGFFPAQHPLAAVLAFGGAGARREWAFNVVADLRWPIENANDPPFAREVAGWFRTALAQEIEPRLQREGIAVADLLTAPAPDAPASCDYCPRCQAQFVAGRQTCPNGIGLVPLLREKR